MAIHPRSQLAENLHRADLTQLQRKEQIAEWIRLTDEKVAGVRLLSTGRGHEGGLRAAAREIGVKRTSAQEAIKVASLSDEAKVAARSLGWDEIDAIEIDCSDVDARLWEIASCRADAAATQGADRGMDSIDG